HRTAPSRLCNRFIGYVNLNFTSFKEPLLKLLFQTILEEVVRSFRISVLTSWKVPSNLTCVIFIYVRSTRDTTDDSCFYCQRFLANHPW
ncbi:MAG TPA: hypothetical protein VJH05_02585, partial [Candidatus Paceibacterota bacterium]